MSAMGTLIPLYWAQRVIDTIGESDTDRATVAQ